MAETYYVDTSIWMDLYEDRVGNHGERFGDFALRFLSFVRATETRLVISDVLLKELETFYSLEEVNGMMAPFETNLHRIYSTIEEKSEAKKIAQERKIPPGDVLHALLARKCRATVITRDHHFEQLKDICQAQRPEELI